MLLPADNDLIEPAKPVVGFVQAQDDIVDAPGKFCSDSFNPPG